jgi:hypothetical protein
MTRIVNHTPFALKIIDESAVPGHRTVSVVVKATFDIVNGQPATIAKQQRPIQPDTPHMDELGRSLAWPTDMVPWKPNTGFFIIGAFHQPAGIAAPTGRAAFTFGPLHKELLFLGPRRAEQQPDGNWTLHTATPMTTVPLRWELSYGGVSDPRNPYGKGQKIETVNGTKVIHLPQIEDPLHRLTSMHDRPEPANFAPVPPMFQARQRKLGSRDREWALFRAPLPPLDYDPSYANAAPDDQQVGDHPRGDETITLLNLHKNHPRLVVTLPGLKIRVAALRASPAGLVPEDVPIINDTVIMVPDDDQLVLLFRGRIALRTTDYETELPWIACEMERLGAPASPSSPAERLLARATREEDKANAALATLNAQSMAEIAKLLPKAKLPPELAALIMSEPDPMKVFRALETHTNTLIDAAMAKYSIS